MERLKIGGIYTTDKVMIKQRTVLIILTLTDTSVLYYLLKIEENYTNNDIKNIIVNQLRWYETIHKNYQNYSKNFFLNMIDGYLGQIDEDLIVKLIKDNRTWNLSLYKDK